MKSWFWDGRRSDIDKIDGYTASQTASPLPMLETQNREALETYVLVADEAGTLELRITQELYLTTIYEHYKRKAKQS